MPHSRLHTEHRNKRPRMLDPKKRLLHLKTQGELGQDSHWRDGIGISNRKRNRPDVVREKIRGGHRAPVRSLNEAIEIFDGHVHIHGRINRLLRQQSHINAFRSQKDIPGVLLLLRGIAV